MSIRPSVGLKKSLRSSAPLDLLFFLGNIFFGQSKVLVYFIKEKIVPLKRLEATKIVTFFLLFMEAYNNPVLLLSYFEVRKLHPFPKRTKLTQPPKVSFLITQK